MTHEILINVTPQETRVAMLEQGIVQELHIERAQRARARRQHLPRARRARAARHAERVRRDRPRARGVPAHRRHLGAPAERPRRRRLAPDREDPARGPVAARAGDQGPDRHQGRAPVDAGEPRRPPARLPAAGLAHRHLAADRGRGRARAAAREAPAAAAGGTHAAASSSARWPRPPPSARCRTTSTTCTKLWGDLNARAREVPAPALLYQDLNLAQRVLRDMATEETVAHRRRLARDLHQDAGVRARVHAGAASSASQHHTGDRPLFDLHGVEDEIEKALARRVDLKSGGYLIVDQTEAMTTIDVNTGGFVGGRSFDDTIFKTNLEAAQVIARQLRLRNLGGIIILDFIDMENADHRDAVLAELEPRAGEGPHAAHGERLHAAGPGRDDEQAHARVAGARAVRALPDLPGPRPAQDRADDLLRDPARDPARGEAVQRARVPDPRRRSR